MTCVRLALRPTGIVCSVLAGLFLMALSGMRLAEDRMTLQVTNGFDEYYCDVVLLLLLRSVSIYKFASTHGVWKIFREFGTISYRSNKYVTFDVVVSAFYIVMRSYSNLYS